MNTNKSAFLAFLLLVVPTMASLKGSVSVPVPDEMSYHVKPDYRDCLPLTCGGFWLKAVNEKETKCGDGTSAEECYVTGFDFSSLGYPLGEQERFKREVGNGGIVSGSYAPYIWPDDTYGGEKLFKLVVSAGWSPFEPKCLCGPDEVCVDDPTDECTGCGCPTICRKASSMCGGIAGIECPNKELFCVDTPNDECDPACGGADCGGICVSFGKKKEECKAIAGTDADSTCSTIGSTCFDEPGDDCGVDCQQSCPGICGMAVGDACGGFAGITCGPGLECVDPLFDGCDLACGGADCGGICLPTE